MSDDEFTLDDLKLIRATLDRIAILDKQVEAERREKVRTLIHSLAEEFTDGCTSIYIEIVR